MSNWIVGLDIGTTKVCVIVARRNGPNLTIIGYGNVPLQRGMKQGMVQDMEKVASAIEKAVSDAERMIEEKITDVVIGIAGEHIRGIEASGTTTIGNGRGGTITQRDIAKAIQNAKIKRISNSSHRIIHVIPQEYIVDGQGGIQNPVNMFGRILEAKIYVIEGNINAIENIIACCEMNNLKVRDIVLQSIASAEAVLYDEEKEIGSALVDIGGGTTDIAVFHSNSLVGTAEVNLGGYHITQDIAVAFQIPYQKAEEIKKEYGHAIPDKISEKEIIKNVQVIGGKNPHYIDISRKELAVVINARVEEILTNVKKHLEEIEARKQTSSLKINSVVLTGGTALLPGIDELARQILGRHVRVGVPQNIEIVFEDDLTNPIFSTAIGLVLWADRHFPLEEEPYTVKKRKKFFARFVEKVKIWFSALFG